MNTVIYILLGIIVVLLVIAMIKISSLEKKLVAGSDSAEIKNEIARSRTETLQNVNSSFQMLGEMISNNM